MMVLFAVGALIVTNVLIVWKHTLLPVHIYKLLNPRRSVYTHEDWELDMALRFGAVGDVLTCSLCFSTHVSWVVALVICGITAAPLWLVLLGMFTWPVIAYTAERMLPKPSHSLADHSINQKAP